MRTGVTATESESADGKRLDAAVAAGGDVRRSNARRRLLSGTTVMAAFASSFGVAAWATRPSFAAKFGPIDDHEPLIWMGPDGHLPWSQFWTTFIDKTEVGQWGHSGRFRPAYYLFRVGQTVLFGDNPRAWYACVLVLFAAACGLLGYVAATWLAAAVEADSAAAVRALLIGSAALASFLFAGLYAWTGIVARLGPAELVGLVAAGVVLLSLTKLALGEARWWWFPALLSVTAATFAKESFFSLGLAFPLVGAYSYYELGRRKSDLIAGALGVVPAMLLALALAPTLLRSRHDVYDSGVGTSRLSGAISALSLSPLHHAFLTGTLVLFAWAAVAVTSSKANWRTLTFLLAVIIWLFACIFLDDWFYGGDYSLPRYRAIADMVIMLQSIGAVCLSIFAVRRSHASRTAIRAVAAVSMALSTFYLVRFVSPSMSNLRLTHQNAIDHAATSNAYQRGLSEALTRLAAEPHPELAVVATKGSDYEPAYAVLNEIARRTDDRPREFLIVRSSAPKGDALLHKMARVSRRGAHDWHTRPVAEVAGTAAAVCVFLNERPHPVDGCRRGAAIRLVAQGM